jgi:oligopeptide/dipeptide ABC transporter ATP-binding protein
MSEAPAPILELARVRKEFALQGSLAARMLGLAPRVIALDDVSLAIREGEVFGLVGESGSGKSTLAHAIVRLTNLTSGTIRYRGQDITRLRSADLGGLRGRIQLVFQDSHSSLNPRKTVAQALQDPLRLCGVPAADRRNRAAELLSRVGLDAAFLDRYPHELSGGQRQRVGIARALAMSPDLLIADEPVSSLDVSLQAQILNLLIDLRRQLGLTIIFISHDLAVVNNISTRVGVMYAGRIVEIGEPAEVLKAPAHPYTAALLASIPAGLDGRARGRPPVLGEPPDPAHLPPGCRFVTRCPHAMAVCRDEYPRTTMLSQTHEAECHLLAS